MLFTIFNYLPILEEETVGHRVEMAKKGNSNDCSNNDGENDGDTDDNNESAVDAFYETGLLVKLSTAQYFYTKNKSYRHLYANTITPPPKL